MIQPANKEAVFSTLGLLMNISLEITQAFKDQSEALCGQLLPLLKCGDADVEEVHISWVWVWTYSFELENKWN